MTTLNENGEVLHEGYLRMADDTGMPYERITPAIYARWKAQRHASAYVEGVHTFRFRGGPFRRSHG